MVEPAVQALPQAGLPSQRPLPSCGSYDLEILDLDVPADCWATEYRSKGPSPYMLLADGRLVLKPSPP